VTADRIAEIKAASAPVLGDRETWDYRCAPEGEGPLAYEWSDKPHRLVYDLSGAVERLTAELAEARAEQKRLAWFEDDWKLNDGARLQEQTDADKLLTREEMEAWEDARRGDVRSFRLHHHVQRLLQGIVVDPELANLRALLAERDATITQLTATEAALRWALNEHLGCGPDGCSIHDVPAHRAALDSEGQEAATEAAGKRWRGPIGPMAPHRSDCGYMTFGHYGDCVPAAEGAGQTT
jgi:hypothetical protein